MHIRSEDEYFAVTLTPAGARRFFVFSLTFGDEVISGGEPEIAYTSVDALSRLRPMTDPRLDPDLGSATALLDLLTSDAWLDVEDERNLYELTRVDWGEAMDVYTSRAYLWDAEAVFLFRRQHLAAEPAGLRDAPTEARMFRVSRLELAAIAAAAMAALIALDAAR